MDSRLRGNDVFLSFARGSFVWRIDNQAAGKLIEPSCPLARSAGGAIMCKQTAFEYFLTPVTDSFRRAFRED